MDLTFQILVQYCFLQHRILLPSPVTPTPGCCFCFGSTFSFLLQYFSTDLQHIGHLWTWGVHLQCHIFLPFHTVHGVLKARILKWFTIPFSSGPHFVRSLHYDSPLLMALHSMAYGFTELDKAVVHVIRLVSFLWL